MDVRLLRLTTYEDSSLRFSIVSSLRDFDSSPSGLASAPRDSAAFSCFLLISLICSSRASKAASSSLSAFSIARSKASSVTMILSREKWMPSTSSYPLGDSGASPRVTSSGYCSRMSFFSPVSGVGLASSGVTNSEGSIPRALAVASMNSCIAGLRPRRSST